jgi:hypothetical protein
VKIRCTRIRRIKSGDVARGRVNKRYVRAGAVMAVDLSIIRLLYIPSSQS